MIKAIFETPTNTLAFQMQVRQGALRRFLVLVLLLDIHLQDSVVLFVRSRITVRFALSSGGMLQRPEPSASAMHFPQRMWPEGFRDAIHSSKSQHRNVATNGKHLALQEHFGKPVLPVRSRLDWGNQLCEAEHFTDIAAMHWCEYACESTWNEIF